MRRFIVAAITSLALAAFAAAGATAAPNPSGTGQPGAECGEPGATSQPAGFGTTGFAKAEDHYANISGTHRVSQYDVACYQVTSKHSGS